MMIKKKFMIKIENKVYSWQVNWELKSLTYNELFQIIESMISKRIIDDMQNKKFEIKIENNFYNDFFIDSVDIIAILINLDVLFQNVSPTEKSVFPTNKVNEIKLVGDLFDLIYHTLLNLEATNSSLNLKLQLKSILDEKK